MYIKVRSKKSSRGELTTLLTEGKLAQMHHLNNTSLWSICHIIALSGRLRGKLILILNKQFTYKIYPSREY